jgi:hypothetical protein
MVIAPLTYAKLTARVRNGRLGSLGGARTPVALATPRVPGLFFNAACCICFPNQALRTKVAAFTKANEEAT